MIIWLLFLLCPFSLHGIITKGYALTSPSGPIAIALGDTHPSPEYTPPEDGVRNQVEICRKFAEQQSRDNTVFLVEEIAPSITKIYDEIEEASILHDIHKIATSTGFEYKNIDLRSATIAAHHVFARRQRNEKINKRLSFGPSLSEMKKPTRVTWDDLFEEKERYIENIRQFSWLGSEQKKVDRLHDALSNTLKLYDVRDLSMRVRDFCKQQPDEAREKVLEAMDNLSFYLFDKYATKVVLDYTENRRYKVLLAAGFVHVTNIKSQLTAEHGWDYRAYCKGEYLSGYDLKTMLGITTWWDYTKSIFGYL